jgi:phosphomannomutase
MAHARAALTGVDLVFGTDPDADRIGCEVWHRGAWVHLTGNDIGALVVAHAVGRAAPGRRPLVITTEVTSALVGRVAAALGAVVIDDLLVGFKYVAEVLRALEEEGRYGDILASDVVFVAGLEESHGVLVTDQIRDKDAAGGALALAELAEDAAGRGGTLVDVLHRLEFEHGAVRTGQLNLQFPGASGAGQMAALLDALRRTPPATIDGRAVQRADDHQDISGRFGPFRSASDRAGRNVLSYGLAPTPGDDGARVILRPSGTEPKLKVYLEVSGPRGLDPAGRAEIGARVDRLGAAVRAALLG